MQVVNPLRYSPCACPRPGSTAYGLRSGNIAPIAFADSYSVDEDTPLNVLVGTGVLSNDTDTESDPLTAVEVTGPAHGSLTLNANGSFTYTPSANYSGADSFTYKANDGALDSNTVTVSLTVNPVADAPVIYISIREAFFSNRKK